MTTWNGPGLNTAFGRGTPREIAQTIARKRIRLMDPEFLDAMGEESVELEIIREILDSFQMEAEVASR